MFFVKMLLIYIMSSLIPLFFPVGRNFEYEYTLMVSWGMMLFVPLSSIFFSPHFFRQQGLLSSKFVHFQLLAVICPIILFIPGLYAFFSHTCQCSYSGFIFWMAIQVVPAIFISHALFYLMLRMRMNGLKTRYVIVTLAAIFAAMAIFDGYQMWFHPQKRISSVFWGFIHGPVYDNLIVFDYGILFSRISHFFLGLSLLFLAWLVPKWKMITIFVLSLTAWGYTSFRASDFDSAKNGKQYLTQLLNQSIKSTDYTLYYMKSSAESDIKRLHLAAQFHIEELKRKLSLQQYPHIEIYVYPDEESKKLWFGGGSTDVTDVVTPSIHITTADWSHPTLRHELVHALLSDVGFYGLGFHPNMAFTEGLAVALAPSEKYITVDDGAAAIIKQNKIKNIENVFSPMFWLESGHAAYTVAGSFIKYLIEKHGIEGVVAKYAGKSWQEAFNVNQEQLITEWKNSILSNYDESRYKMYAEALFRESSFFTEICTHSRVDLRQSRDKSIFVRLRQPLNWDVHQYQDWLKKVVPQDPRIYINEYKKQANDLNSVAKLNVDGVKILLEKIERTKKMPPKSLEDVELAILQSDLLLMIDDKEKSDQILTDLETASQNAYLSDNFVRDILVRKVLGATLDVRELKRWRAYLNSWNVNVNLQFQASDPFIIQYLKLRRRDKVQHTWTDLMMLKDFVFENSTPPILLLEWHRYLALRFMDLQKFDEASTVWEQTKQYAREAQQESLLENSRLAKFFAEQWEK